MKKVHLVLIFAFIGITAINSVIAQQKSRNNFLVDKIERVEEPPGYNLCEYIYDTENKLIKLIAISHFFEQGKWRDGKYVLIFEYKHGYVSKIMYYDSTHFMFNHEIHFFYNNQGQLIKSESRMPNGYLVDYSEFYYKNGFIDSVYYDDKTYWLGIIHVYDDAMNVTKCIYTSPKHGLLGEIIPGEYVVSECDFEYDSNLKPYFGFDYPFVYQLLPGLGTVHFYEMLLSNNNMTKAIDLGRTYNYTYNVHGLPESYEMMWKMGDQFVSAMISKITYKQIETGISEKEQESAKIIIHPNPTKDIFFIECINPTTITLYDILGKEVAYHVSTKVTEINISNLPQGVYFVNVFTEKGCVVKKIVKQ